MPRSSVEPVLLKLIPAPAPPPLLPFVVGLPYLSIRLDMHLRGQGTSLSFVLATYSPPPALSLSRLSGRPTLGPCKHDRYRSMQDRIVIPEVREPPSCVELQQVQGIRTAVDVQPQYNHVY